MSLTALFKALMRKHFTTKTWLIMKLMMLFTLIACIQAAASGNAQTVSISGKNLTLESVFKEIRNQANYEFVYKTKMLEKASRVDLDVQNATVESVLQICFANQPITYTIIDKTIIIKAKPKPTTADLSTKALEKVEASAKVNPIDISGRVTDTDGNPLEGATVIVKGTNITTTTNSNGEFQLTGISENATLEISYVGYETYTVAVNNKTSIVASLKLKPDNLNEVIIKKGYYDEKQRFTLGNSVHIGKEAFEQSPVQNPLLAIQGRATGIEITQKTGMNGGGVKVRIQGQNSLRSDALEPLIIIDGVPYPSQFIQAFETVTQGGSPLNHINPNDIESIDILKDADATALYGSRAANGAIIITTKRGKTGKNKLSINLQQGWGKVTRRADMMNTRQYLDMRYEAYKNDRISIGTLSPDFSNHDITIWDTTRYTDWQKTLIGGTAQYTNVNASLSGGTSAIQYLIGGTYNRQTTVFPGDFDDKAGTLHFNINSVSTNQRLKVQLTGSYSYNQNHLPGVDLTEQAILLEPNAPELFNTNGTLNWKPDAAGNSTFVNPLAYTQSSEYNNSTKNLVSNFNVKYRILPGLDFTSSFGYTNTQSEFWLPTRLETYRPEIRASQQRTATFGNRNLNSWIIEPQLQYAGKLSKGKIEAFIGTSIQKSNFNYLGIVGSGFPTDLLMKTLNAASSTTIQINTSYTNRFNALFGRFGYIWDDKFLINLTARRDGSNSFGDENRFHNFGSIAAGWIFSEEKWIQQSLPFLSFGKLRSSYGTTGNDQIPPFSYLSNYDISNPTILYQNSIGLNPRNIPNPDLQWESTRKWQAGLDLGFIKDRISVGATYVRNRSNNQLVAFVVPTVTGFSNYTKNFPATIQNTSWEVTLNTVNLKSSNISWKTSINLTIPKNKLISFPGIELTAYASQTDGIIIGQPLGTGKVYQFAGVNPSNGRYLVIDKSGHPNTSTTFADRSVFISGLTKYYGGVVNSISYKGLQLEFLVQFVRKKGPRDLFWYNGTRYPGEFIRGQSNQSVAVLNHWQKPGDNEIIGRFSTSSLLTSITSSDAYYSYDASFIRLKNVSLSWQLPVSWIQKAHLQNARLYLHAQNLVTVTKYSGLDPETMNISGLPPLRMITIGGQIEF
jgi:TonB-linked SusC/RagA family outer membrane protein